MQLVKGFVVAAIATVTCFAPTTATDEKEHTTAERQLYYVRTPITKNPYNRVIPPPPPIQHN